MKLLRGATFSHPVVAPFLDDVKAGNFHLRNFAVKADGANYRLMVDFELGNPGLLEYIRKGKAGYALLVEARGLFYRKLYSPLPEKQELIIDGDLLSGSIDCIPLVVATADIPEYVLDDFNADYRGLKISISSGDVLAISSGQTFVAEKMYDSLQKLSSIMQVIRDEKVAPGSMDVALHEDKITIYVCPQDHEKYGTLSKLPEAAPLLMQSLAVPALQEAIVEMRREDGSSGERRWELALRKRLDVMKITIGDSSTADIACRLLEGPLSASFSSLDDLISGGNEE
ncbi:hypothetical protein SCL_2496 [Sulfuricaulis limicola]|uniref:Uncharacterized protein n=1 Tax=Sulfuricaulis limicola TaxID=1620215 RepID=A0A1B4XIZ1_9GAMM|nr:hypothetical protein [Sulfuricaulis limicola]BAV34773.1 hypothetical protein SCL_2496 [Sulfuricaulis limicola]